MAENRPNDLAARRYRLAGRDLEAPALAPGLYLVATPIGNLRDITLRALETLGCGGISLPARTRGSPASCSTTTASRPRPRPTMITTPRRRAHGCSNASQWRVGRACLRCRYAAGVNPGFKLVREACVAGTDRFTAVPAHHPFSQVERRGLPSDRFFFEGFLRRKSAGRQKRAAELARIPATLILFESGPRIGASLADLAPCSGRAPRRCAVS